jgi:hypothetical protein
MAVDVAFLKATLTKEGATDDDKISLIIGEHKAEINGLVQKRDELLAEQKDLKTKLDSAETKATQAAASAAEFEEKLKKSAPEDKVKLLEATNEAAKKQWEQEKQALDAQILQLREARNTSLRNDNIADAIKDLKFVEGLKDGFVARVMALNDFQPKEIDGKTLFLNKDSKDIASAIQEFALSKEGKAYIQNPSSGGGAAGGSKAPAGALSITRAQFEAMQPQQKAEFFQKGGQIA